MATIHDRFKLAALNGSCDEFDVGSADANGDIQLLDSVPAELAQIQFGNPAFGAAAMNGANAVADANAMAQDNSVTPGDIAEVRLRDRDNVSMYGGTVGLPGSGANLIMDSVTIPSGAEFVRINAFTIAFAFG